MVAFDATFLLLLFKPDVPAPLDPSTGSPVTAATERIEHLVDQLDEAGTRVIVATPALSEILVRAGPAGNKYLSILNKQAVFRIAPFNQRAAIELAAMAAAHYAGGDKRGGGEGTYAKIKYDRQIVAIAKVEGATTIYSDDENVQKFGTANGMTVTGLHQLPLPPKGAQGTLGFEESNGEETESQ